MLYSLVTLIAVAHLVSAQLGGLFGSPSPAPAGGPADSGSLFGNLQNILSGLGGGASVNANGQVQNPGGLLSGLMLPQGLSLESLKGALGNLNLPDLGFKTGEAQAGSAFANVPGFQFLNGILSNKPPADPAAAPAQVGTDVVTASPFDVQGALAVLKDKVLQTVSALSLKTGASLDVGSGAAASSGVLQLLGGNNVNVAADGSLKSGLLLVNEAESKIVGGFQIIGDHLAKVAAAAKLQLGDAAANPKVAEILAKFDLANGAKLDIASATKLLGDSQILGQGNVNIQSLLDLSQVKIDLASQQAQQALIEAKSLALGKLADLKLAVQKGTATLVDVDGNLNFGGAKIDISGAAALQASILKLLHGSAEGKADITVDGKAVVDVTAGKVNTPPPAGTGADAKVWTVNYGPKETTLELKSAMEVYAATTIAAAETTIAASSQVTVAVAAVVVAALASMN